MKPNCVILLVSSLRYDVLKGNRDAGSLSEYDLVEELETPTLDRLLEEGREFPALHATHPSNPPSVASTLTGKYPREHLLFGTYRTLDSQTRTLADYFSEADYKTLLFNGHSTYESNGIAARFDEFIQGNPDLLIDRIQSSNRNGSPVFALYHTVDCGVPYLLSKFPPTYEYHEEAVHIANQLSLTLGKEQTFSLSDSQRLTNHWSVPWAGDPSLPVWEFFLESLYRPLSQGSSPIENPDFSLLEMYVKGVNRFDQKKLGRLVDALCDIERETTLLLTSDRGDSPAFPGGYYVEGTDTKPVEDIMRIPGILWNASGSTAFEEWPVTSSVNVAPTLLEQCGIPFEDVEFSGRSLHRSPPEDLCVYSESSRSLSPESTHQTIPLPAVLTWQSILSDEGEKLYRWGQGMLEEDYSRSLEDFFLRVFEEIMAEPPTEDMIRERVTNFRDKDSPEARRELVRVLRNEHPRPKPELYHWKDDPLEQTNLLEQTADPPNLEWLEEKLSSRFAPTFELREPFSEHKKIQKRVQFTSPLQTVGYVE